MATLDVSVRPATAADIRPLAGVLGRAFEDDPPFVWMLPDAKTRPARAGRFFATLLRTEAPTAPCGKTSTADASSCTYGVPGTDTFTVPADQGGSGGSPGAHGAAGVSLKGCVGGSAGSAGSAADHSSSYQRSNSRWAVKRTVRQCGDLAVRSKR